MVTTKSLKRSISNKRPSVDLARMVFVRADETFYLCAVPVASRIDMEILSWLLGADEIHLASAEEIAQLHSNRESDGATGLEKIFGLPSIIDKRLRPNAEMTLQTLPNSNPIQINLTHFERITVAQVLDFCD